MKILLLTLFLSFSSIGISYADFQNGMNAFDKGEYNDWKNKLAQAGVSYGFKSRSNRY